MEEKNSSYAIGIPASYAAVRGYNVTVQDDQAPDSAADPAPAPAPAPAPSLADFFMFMFFISFVTLCGFGLIFFTSPNPKFGLKSLSVSDFKISGSEITANWDAEFLVRNSRAGTCYEHLLVCVFYKDKLISDVVLAPQLDLLPKSMGSNYVAKTVALSKRIENRFVADAIARDYWSQGAVAFTVRLLHDVRGQYVNVICSDIKVGFSNHSSHATLLITNQQAFTLCSTHLTH
ncbi:hypothetical protein CCACVL1_17798 [Corchorus capsularis]|uniref:Late embryogenesis abundant protein, LEA-14 n=1 Tax=Corchorus capsularis TaxID=210143 RepID=A0A1R3HQ26_COCAP|nr:hypothetical protein CCACVL1_17798 [Corchorus capsularis]